MVLKSIHRVPKTQQPIRRPLQVNLQGAVSFTDLAAPYEKHLAAIWTPSSADTPSDAPMTSRRRLLPRVWSILWVFPGSYLKRTQPMALASAMTFPQMCSTQESQTLAHELDMPAVVAGTKRLSAADALRLFHEAPLTDLGRWASLVAERIHGGAGSPRTYVIDRNINYTNVCSARCTFCAFRRDETDTDAYTLTRDQLHQKVKELVNIGGTQVLLQGGMHPGLPLSFYEDMLRGLKSAFPSVHIHGFSPPEFVEFVAVLDFDGFPVTEPGKSHTLPEDVWQAKLLAVLKRLQAAGLDSLPGGGGEIFAEHVRRRIGLGKATGRQWLDVMSAAHRLGMHTSATMMFGHVEGVMDRIDHMLRLRDAQDRAISEKWPGRYHSFIAWPFQRENTPLGRLKEFDPSTGLAFPGDELALGRPAPEAGKVLRMSSATDYLRTQALSRLILDNFHSIGSSWVTMGPKIGQLGLFFGANDMGSVMMEENVVSSAGTTYCLNEPVLCRLIRDAGFIPAQRDNHYRIITRHEGPGSPDLKVKDWSEHRVKKLHTEKPAEKPAEPVGVKLTIGKK
jgi:cyclic dehypoxanthinyl futalosine synthase